MSDPEEPQVSWKTIEENAVVFCSDGTEVGKVKETAGDHQADIFDGLIVSHRRGPDRYVPAEQVRGIWEERVELALTAGEIEALPAYAEPRSVRWEPGADRGLGGRVRGAFHDLFGRRR